MAFVELIEEVFPKGFLSRSEHDGLAGKTPVVALVPARLGSEDHLRQTAVTRLEQAGFHPDGTGQDGTRVFPF